MLISNNCWKTVLLFYNVPSNFDFYGFLRYFKIYWFQLGSSMFYFLQCAELFRGLRGFIVWDKEELPRGLRRRIAVRINAQQPQPASSVFLCFTLFFSVLLFFTMLFSVLLCFTLFNANNPNPRPAPYRLGNNWQKTIFQARPLTQLHSARGRGGTIQ